jgi:hypothetical protein
VLEISSWSWKKIEDQQGDIVILYMLAVGAGPSVVPRKHENSYGCQSDEQEDESNGQTGESPTNF